MGEDNCDSDLFDSMASVPGSRWALTQDAFDSLLSWLDADRELAGYRYEDIRYRLIKIFAHRGCVEPEELADETINRVAQKARTLSVSYVGDPARYFFGVAQNVLKERLRHRTGPVDLMPLRDKTPEEEFQCLERCLGQLTSESRDLILGYYEGEKRGKIDHRKRLATRLGLETSTLRIRAYRIRAALQACLNECIGVARTVADRNQKLH
ncbi:MAG TPA: hypothetical protein VEZ90_08290 [Blastocatellia bacterium]|nr:hypothetical protein [Blastocatellia bacterium]